MLEMCVCACVRTESWVWCLCTDTILPLLYYIYPQYITNKVVVRTFILY